MIASIVLKHNKHGWDKGTLSRDAKLGILIRHTEL